MRLSASFNTSNLEPVQDLASAVIDNIPIMFAVLGMHPEMSTGQ